MKAPGRRLCTGHHGQPQRRRPKDTNTVSDLWEVHHPELTQAYPNTAHQHTVIMASILNWALTPVWSFLSPSQHLCSFSTQRYFTVFKPVSQVQMRSTLPPQLHPSLHPHSTFPCFCCYNGTGIPPLYYKESHQCPGSHVHLLPIQL